MCRTREQWEICNSSAAVHAATKFALQLEEYAKRIGYNPKEIRVRNKEQILKGGYGKADAQVIWKEGPDDWELDVIFEDTEVVDSTVEDEKSISFYNK